MVATLGFSEPCRAQAQSHDGAKPEIADSDQPDFNRQIYYKNKLELAFDTGWLWYNTPLILDPIIGDKFAREPGAEDYTLVPLDFSVRWHLYDICGPSILRGNTDFTFSGSYTDIERGPESRYVAAIAGFRYNFIQPNWRLVPFLELRGGMGFTDAQQPNEVAHNRPAVGQGQDFTFNFLMGAGVRYNFNPTYSVSAGVTFMHVSNMYLSEPRYYNHGINVVGPSIGLNIALPSISSAFRTMTEGVRIPLDQVAAKL
jgi:lipid A 3-O-deacylase